MSPQIQWLGRIPSKEGHVARAIGGGLKAFGAARERKEERGLQLEKVDYDKKVAAANMIIDAKKHMNDTSAAELDAKSEVRELFKDLDWPYPEGSLMGATNLKIEAVKAVVEGRTIPGMSMEETKKAAGVFIPDKKITATDVKAFKKEVPFHERLWPGTQTEAGKEYLRMKEGYRKQFGTGVRRGTTGDPLGAR